MTCHDARDLFPELLDRRTAPSAQAEARAHLAACPACQREFAELSETLTALDTMRTSQPTPALRQNFHAFLAAEKAAAAEAPATRKLVRPKRPFPWRWILSPLIGAALLVFGFVAGTRHAASRAQPTSEIASATALRKIDELERKLNTMGELVVASSLLQQQQQPANDRLRGVLTSATTASEHPTESVINQLILALALDPSANIRLRALDGLFPHADHEVVRAGVLASLPREQNPMVQVSMIDFLAASRDVEARPALEKIAISATTDASVRDAAKRALTQF